MATLPKGQGILLPPFKAWLASNIPAVYDNTMTYYEELCALIKYLQDIVVPAVNENASAVTTISNAVEQLQKYVEDYFENLDVQEEINNKLDQMAENGTLQEIITTYIQSNVAWTFDNVEDMQNATNLVNGSYAQTLGRTSVGDGGGAMYKILNTGTPDNLNVFSIGDNLYAHNVNLGARKISLSELEQVTEGVFTLGEVEVTSPIELPRQVNRGIIIVDTVFKIKTPILFPPYNVSSYFILPSFVGCSFINDTSDDSRVAITANGTNTVASRFNGCNFDGVDAIHDNGYVQDFNFTGCYIKSHTCFIETTGTAQVRMINCSVENACNQLISCDRIFGYFSGTYEGNVNKDFYFIDCNYGFVNLENAWLESTKFLDLKGEDVIAKKSSISINNSLINGGSDNTPQIYITDGSFVEFSTSGTSFSAYSQQSRVCNLTPSQFLKCIGSFVYVQVSTWPKEMGGENTYPYEVATLHSLENLENKHFIHSEQKLLANTPNTMVLECGTYLAIMGRGAYGAVNNMHEYVISVSKTQNYAYATKILGSTDTYLDGTTFVPTKANASDTTFTLTLTATTGYTLEVNMIRIS